MRIPGRCAFTVLTERGFSSTSSRVIGRKKRRDMAVPQVLTTRADCLWLCDGLLVRSESAELAASDAGRFRLLAREDSSIGSSGCLQVQEEGPIVQEEGGDARLDG